MPLRFVPRTNTPAALPGFGYRLRTVALYSYGISDDALSASTPVVAGTASGPFNTTTYNATVDADANFLVVALGTTSGSTVTFDAATQSFGNDLTFLHTTSGLNRYLTVGVSIWNGTSISASGITYAGAAMTRLNRSVGTDNTSELWGLVNPALGSNSVAVTLSGATPTIHVGAISFTNADQVTQNGAAGGSSGAASPLASAALTGPVGGMLVDMVDEGGAVTVSTGTQAWNDGGGDAQAYLQTTGVPQSTGWTGVAAPWTMSAGVILPPTASGVTFDGVAMYRLGTVMGNGIRSELWGLANPHVGTLGVVVTGQPGGVGNGAWAFKHVGASPGTDGGVGSTFTGTSGPVTTNAITGAANGLLVGGTAASGGDPTAVGGTEGYSDNGGETLATFASDGSSQTQSWTLGGGTPNVSIMTVALQPVPFDSVGITHAPAVSDNALGTFSDALQKLVLKHVSDTALALTETLTTTRTRTLSDTALSFSDAAVRTPSRTISDTALSFSDSPATTRQRTVSDTALSFSESLVTTRVRTIADTALSFSDSLAATRQRTMSDTALSFSDAVQKLVVKNISDTALSASDSVATQRQHGVSDTALTVTDTIATTRVRSITDTAVSFTDSPATTRQHQIADTGLSFTDTIATLRLRVVADTALSFTDAVGKLVQKNVSDTAVSITDSVGRIASRSVTETFSFSDAVATLRLHNVSDTGLGFSDSVSAMGSGTITVTDTALSFSDSISRSATHNRTTTDTGLSFSDSLATARLRNTTDTGLSFSDSISRSATRTRTASDTALTFSDTVASTSPHTRTATDTVLSFTDTISRNATRSRSVADTFTFSDSVVATKTTGTTVFAPPILAQLI